MRTILTMALVLTAALVSFAEAQQASAPVKAGVPDFPPDLAMLPSDTIYLISIGLTDYWASPEAQSLRLVSNAHPIVPTWWFNEMPTVTGLHPENVVRMMMFATPAESVAAITTRKPYDRAKVLAAFAPNAIEKTVAGKAYYQSAKANNSVFPLNERTLILGMGQDLRGFLSRTASPECDPSLDRALTAIQKGAPLVIHAGPAFIRRTAADQQMPGGPLESLAKAHAWQIVAENNKHLTIKLLADFTTNEEADKSTSALKIVGNELSNLIPFYKSNMPPFLKEQEKQYPGAKELALKMATALDAASEGLKHVDVRSLNSRAGAQIDIDTKEPITTAVLLLTLMPRAAKQPNEK